MNAPGAPVSAPPRIATGFLSSTWLAQRADVAGWPSVAVGTFGGVVSFIDPHDDGQGNFRIVVVPDPREEPWPSARFLRQGVRASAWVLLERVKLGFELWRRFNGFPPMLERAPGASGATANGKEESKP